MKIQIARNPSKLQRALNHAQRRIAKAIHNAIAQRTVIGANPQRPTARFTFLHERRELFLDAREFRRVLFVRVFADDKFFGVSVVARINPNHLAPLHRLQRGVRLEMNIGNHWHI